MLTANTYQLCTSNYWWCSCSGTWSEHASMKFSPRFFRSNKTIIIGIVFAPLAIISYHLLVIYEEPLHESKYNKKHTKSWNMMLEMKPRWAHLLGLSDGRVATEDQFEVTSLHLLRLTNPLIKDLLVVVSAQCLRHCIIINLSAKSIKLLLQKLISFKTVQYL